MRRPAVRIFLLVLTAAALGVSSAFLVACGDRNDLIPRSDASSIESDLDQASDLYAQQECRQAQAAVVRAQGRADDLPDAVDSDLRSTLSENLQHVLQRIQVQCGRTQTTQTTATTPPTTETTQTTTAPPTTTTVPPTTTTEPPTTTTAPPTTTDSGGTPAGPGGSGGSP